MKQSQTRVLMMLSALVMLGLGVLLTFAPGEVVGAIGGSQSPLIAVGAQIGGALYLSFAMLNWMAKDNLIGGIYSRPVAIGNFLHFAVVSTALLKAFSSLPRSAGTFAFVLTYFLLAVGFGVVLFVDPKTEEQTQKRLQSS